MNVKITSLIAFPIRIYLGIVFLLACLHKISYPESFAVDVASYQFLPLWAVNIFAIIMPILEFIAAVTIIIGFRSRASAMLIAGMMLSFIVALSWALNLGLDMSCGCFASNSLENEDPISSMTLVRDMVWFILALFVVLFDRTPIGVDYFLSKRSRKDETQNA